MVLAVVLLVNFIERSDLISLLWVRPNKGPWDRRSMSYGRSMGYRKK